jgi:hypothetical protein
MTPEEWERCAEPQKMLEFLRPSARASDRKLRLFGAGCCRALWAQLTDPAGRRAVEVAEQYADGKAGRRALARAKNEVELAVSAAFQAAALKGVPGSPALTAARSLTMEEAWYAAACAARYAAAFMPGASQGALLRCVVGNPCRGAVVLAPAVLAYNRGAVMRRAESIYKSRRFEGLPVLADLLEGAGLTDADLLGHLRGPGPHCLGCHALDAVLGKA